MGSLQAGIEMRFVLLLPALIGLAAASPIADKNAQERFGFGLIEGAIGAVANALATTTTAAPTTTTTYPTTTTTTKTPPTTTTTTTTTTTRKPIQPLSSSEQ